jgi:hypothetical protein
MLLNERGFLTRLIGVPAGGTVGVPAGRVLEGGREGPGVLEGLVCALSAGRGIE